MPKYDPLGAHLERRGEDEFELGFEELERIIGTALPDSAARPQWWANETSPETRHSQRGAWASAGYEAFLLPDRRVLFRRPLGGVPRARCGSEQRDHRPRRSK